jgi:hypothetical protein
MKIHQKKKRNPNKFFNTNQIKKMEGSERVALGPWKMWREWYDEALTTRTKTPSINKSSQ